MNGVAMPLRHATLSFPVAEFVRIHGSRETCDGTLTSSATKLSRSQPLAGNGLRLAVEQVLLVGDLQRSQEVREVVEELKKKGYGSYTIK